jgi:excisionase family DNA binding protein
MSEPQKGELAARRWLTVAQLMEVVPLRKSRVYYLTHTRQIPFTRVGKTLLFDYHAIVRWMESHGEPVGLSHQAR